MTNFYPKINGVFKRFREGPDKNKFMFGEFSLPEYEQLLDIEWSWTEKWDGTSAGIYFDDKTEVFGRTANTLMSEDMRDALWRYADANTDFHGSGLTVYGELVGPKIQGNPHKFNVVTFQPFDVRYGHTWWTKQRVFDEIPGAGSVERDTLRNAIANFVKYDQSETFVEGVVGTPDLCDLKGRRITTKLKWRDFQ